MEYNHRDIEQRWQHYWKEKDTYKTTIDHSKPKFYVLDMFPYPSGAGLHVGHPLGYIASDIFARYKRHKGFNVLHPMGFDAYGLPAEQYAIQTGTHPAVTTEINIQRYREQLDKIGFSYDWSRQVKTCDPAYYKWTQWTFIQLFNSWYNNNTLKAEPVADLIQAFEKEGTSGIHAACSGDLTFTAGEWKSFSEKKQQELLMNYRLAYLSESWVNWCPGLGTVLANDEVKDGISERGGFPVERKLMKQWSLRITAYSQRLLDGLEKIDWPESLKDMQRNWIGRSEGASVLFDIKGHDDKLEVFTTRPDTLFGATFMVLAPEHELAMKITVSDRQEAVKRYIEAAKNRSERERMAEVKRISGEFTGTYGINPINGKEIPIWIADYVLAGYGTGAIMAVPAHDSRDFAFARHFNLPVIQVVSEGKQTGEDVSKWENSYDAKSGIMIHSGFINGMEVRQAIAETARFLEKEKKGKLKINYRLRDAIFSRQRYWGEPFPVYYKDGMPYMLDHEELPLELPPVDKYLPTENGEPPLARAKNWTNKDGYPLETNTMPGFAGSSGYYLRYMDPGNNSRYFSREANTYWKDIDLYLGGDEHATGHLIYSRFWNMFLYDTGMVCEEEPFKKLINQGKIQGRSSLVYRVNHEKYAEYLLWEKIKENRLGYKFEKEFKYDRRKFDFYCQDANLIIEIKYLPKLEKLAESYHDFAHSSGFKLLLIPIVEILTNLENVVRDIIRYCATDEKGVLFDNYSLQDVNPLFVSHNIPGRDQYSTPLHVDISLVDNDILDTKGFKKWRPEFREAEFINENGRYVCGSEVEKMSKSKHNVVNPDEIIEMYGADTFRLYEMFLGPIESHKPWDTKGIEGVSRFLKKLWRLFYNEKTELAVSSEQATDEELKIIHRTIKKIGEDNERFSFNTAVSQFMICVNELTELGCRKKMVLQDLLVLLSPYAPHITEELWEKLGNTDSISQAVFPEYNPDLIRENTFEYPVSFNGKLRYKIELPLDISGTEVDSIISSSEQTKKYAPGLKIKKIIFVPGKIINVVV